MLSFEEVGLLLDEYTEQLPEEIFAGLNGGVNLINRRRFDEEGNCILGLYNCNGMGRYIEIFYGSLRYMYRELSDDELKAEVKKVLHHELTHHLEHRAGDRSLERWDEERKERFRRERYSDEC